MIKNLSEDRFKGFNLPKGLEVRRNSSRQNEYLKEELKQYNNR